MVFGFLLKLHWNTHKLKILMTSCLTPWCQTCNKLDYEDSFMSCIALLSIQPWMLNRQCNDVWSTPWVNRVGIEYISCVSLHVMHLHVGVICLYLIGQLSKCSTTWVWESISKPTVFDIQVWVVLDFNMKLVPARFTQLSWGTFPLLDSTFKSPGQCKIVICLILEKFILKIQNVRLLCSYSWKFVLKKFMILWIQRNKMLYVHMNWPGSSRKSYVPHTSFLDFSALLQNDENIHTTILHLPSEMSLKVLLDPVVRFNFCHTNLWSRKVDIQLLLIYT